MGKAVFSAAMLPYQLHRTAPQVHTAVCSRPPQRCASAHSEFRNRQCSRHTTASRRPLVASASSNAGERDPGSVKSGSPMPVRQILPAYSSDEVRQGADRYRTAEAHRWEALGKALGSTALIKTVALSDDPEGGGNMLKEGCACRCDCNCDCMRLQPLQPFSVCPEP